MTAPEEATPEGRLGGSDTFKQAVANLIGGNAANTAAATAALANQWVSLHSTDPGNTGAGEITTGTGANGRQKVTWNAATMDTSVSPTRAKITGNTLTFSIASAANIGFYGVWTAQTGGTFLYGKALNPAANLTGAGTVTVNPSHSYGLV